jgi:predicted transcriptional regulator of viral defense system
MTIANYIKQLLSYEEYSFSLGEISESIHKNDTAISRELSRLIAKNEIVNLRKGFYLIITPRYSSAQKLPIQLYCEKLFKYLDRNYYLAHYTAAKFHGASHQQVQRDYLIIEKPKLNDIVNSPIDIRFFTTSNWPDRNIQVKKSDAGIFKVSSPALTIIDLIHHQNKLGGINRMLSVIAELAEELNESDIIDLISWYPYKSSLQRFGFLLGEIGDYAEFQELIFLSLREADFFPILLCPKLGKKAGSVDNRWKVSVNIKLGSDI